VSVPRTPGTLSAQPQNPGACNNGTNHNNSNDVTIIDSGAPAGWVYTKSSGGQDQSITASVTWYGYLDNSGQTESQHNSDDIAYPSNQYHTIHKGATEGTGAYRDPITFAAPPNGANASVFPVGSISMYHLCKNTSSWKISVAILILQGVWKVNIIQISGWVRQRGHLLIMLFLTARVG
jgi:hypothetical protein